MCKQKQTYYNNIELNELTSKLNHSCLVLNQTHAKRMPNKKNENYLSVVEWEIHFEKLLNTQNDNYDNDDNTDIFENMDNVNEIEDHIL